MKASHSQGSSGGHFFLVGFFSITHHRLSERVTTRSLDLSIQDLSIEVHACIWVSISHNTRRIYITNSTLKMRSQFL